MAPRKLKARRQGCWIEATGSGLLRLRFRWRIPTATGLHKFSETTTLRDTPENRAALFEASSDRRRRDRGKSFRLPKLVSEWQQGCLLPTETAVSAVGGTRCRAHDRPVLPSLGCSKGATDSPPFKGSRLSQSFPHVHPSLPRRRGLAGFSARASRRTQGAASDRPSSGNQDRKKRYRRFHARDGA